MLTDRMHYQQVLLGAFSKWQPEEGLTVHAFVSNLANGGYVLVEADDLNVVPLLVGKSSCTGTTSRLFPVVDVIDGVAEIAVRRAVVGNRMDVFAGGDVTEGVSNGRTSV